jgi:rubrerythrin
MGKTMQHLKDAFAGESQANRKYLAFAKQADKEGYLAAARLFRAAAAAETVHAHAHLRAMNGIGSTTENLKEAVEGETYEFKSMYPDMIKDAREEGEKAADQSFTWANEVEQIHAGLYRKALDELGQGEDVKCYYVCSLCGNTVANEPPDVCPVCKAKSKAFERVD